jgi:hypothetical protein
MGVCKGEVLKTLCHLIYLLNYHLQPARLGAEQSLIAWINIVKIPAFDDEFGPRILRVPGRNVAGYNDI